jgi:ATP phosphoribosyltransferase
MANNEKLKLALPSKGRLKEQCEEWLAKSGINLVQIGGARSYSAAIQGLDDVEIHLMSSSEISKALLSGDIHLGITGEDLIKESSANWDSQVQFIQRLGFGFADLVVAVPDGWIDVSHMADLKEVAADLRHAKGYRLKVATKFTRLTSEYFNAHGILDYRIVYSAGATEGAPSSGIAEIIVDITTSGATLSANNLKILDDGLILASCACFIKSKKAKWGKSARHLFEDLQNRIAH